MRIFNLLLEDVSDLPPFSSPEEQLELLSQKIEIAKKALRIANRLKDPKDRAKHQSIVVRHLQVLRRLIRSVENVLLDDIMKSERTTFIHPTFNQRGY